MADLLDKVHSGIASLAKTGKTQLVDGVTKAVEIVNMVKKEMSQFDLNNDIIKSLINGFSNIIDSAQTFIFDELNRAQTQ